MSVRKTLIHNTAFNTAGRLWEAACNIALAAYVVPCLGVSAWGLWAMLSVFTGYVALFDVGLGSGFAKFIAEHAAHKDRGRISSVVSVGFFFYLVLGLVLVCAGWWCIDPAVALFRRLGAQAVDDAFLSDVRVLLRWGLVLFAASNCLSAFSAVQTGLQRMDVANLIGFAASLLKVTGAVYWVHAGHGVRGLLYASFLAFGFHAAASVIAAFLLVPGLRVSPRHISGTEFRALASFGWKTQVSRLSNVISFETDKLIVGLFYRQFGMIGVYRIGEELAGKMRQMPALLVSAIMPAASDLDARDDRERITRLYLVSSKYLAAATLPIGVYCVAASGMLIRTWMGPAVPHLETAAWINRILAIGYLANVLPGAGVSIALGKGRPDLQMKAGIIAMITNVAFTLALVFPFGLYGVAMGTALSMFAACAWFLRAMEPVGGIRAGELMRKTLAWPALACLPGFAFCLAGEFWSAGGSRWLNAVATLGGAIVFFSSYALILFRAPYFDRFDHDVLRSLPIAGRMYGRFHG
ncbi:MAG TPA: oligosaccharide flippase family protein [Candidatus Hydrogenedentes bacterium]|nr:oligosaccharide flippase family protein [Candidatus Hydrogenedentota bacterium]